MKKYIVFLVLALIAIVTVVWMIQPIPEDLKWYLNTSQSVWF